MAPVWSYQSNRYQANIKPQQKPDAAPPARLSGKKREQRSVARSHVLRRSPPHRRTAGRLNDGVSSRDKSTADWNLLLLLSQLPARTEFATAMPQLRRFRAFFGTFQANWWSRRSAMGGATSGWTAPPWMVSLIDFLNNEFSDMDVGISGNYYSEKKPAAGNWIEGRRCRFWRGGFRWRGYSMIDASTGKKCTPFDHGARHVNPISALNRGLHVVLDGGYLQGRLPPQLEEYQRLFMGGGQFHLRSVFVCRTVVDNDNEFGSDSRVNHDQPEENGKLNTTPAIDMDEEQHWRGSYPT
ncbi:3-hydroxy-3-methylglutaryl-coenzyme A reductase [Striga asiatica]|uniref:3-hydroxy-3-methylglutaryl-coenzyme A reductase n=1 Tax=Striga asiatica TaxID=4170 RepID=A0A5A7P0J4_STRAF|nr:3-hydroxy-3-methylglutaryl-coenzyme A reductase [Striga asiatica]